MNVTLPNDLARLQTRFEHWRKTRTARSRIPEDLLQAARAMLDRYSASMVCRACRLHPTSLNKHARTSAGAAQLAKSAGKTVSKPQTAFYSLPPAVYLPDPSVSTQTITADCRLVLERPDGARLTLSLPRLDAATLASLCSDFLRS